LGYEENILKEAFKHNILRYVRELTNKEFEKLEEVFEHTSRTNNVCNFHSIYTTAEKSAQALHYRYLAALRKKEFIKPIKGLKDSSYKNIYRMLDCSRGAWLLNPHWFKPTPDTDLAVELWNMLK
jgi:hypothetical protein